MKIDIWSDIVCPFCSVGRARLQQAIDAFPHSGLREELQITWHSFELDPTTERGTREPVVDHLMAKYQWDRAEAEAKQRMVAEMAADAGLSFAWATAVNANTYDAHRLVHLAAESGWELADRLERRLMTAYLSEGIAVDDHAELTRLAVEVGLPVADVERVLGSDEFKHHVRADEEVAHHMGISGVPFMVFDETIAVAGAQPVGVFTQALTQAWEQAHKPTFQMIGDDGDACGPGGCDLTTGRGSATPPDA